MFKRLYAYLKRLFSLTILKKLGVTFVQGFLYSMPVKPKEALQLAISGLNRQCSELIG
ncbi:hypothetical protein [Vibrio metschnikovii]|uniref:hypothetical protein n=1 Tax=Vibrio metschnikovii TaxID=28172 RepID=UPI001C2FB120|nr:hypothetical protein [Vibrio metschnikovii]MDA3138650.1 hypothetical protein [Vibrio metschnikovii]